MDPVLTSVLLLATVSGYGDVDGAGYPSWAERDIHLWTNAARVDPEAFEADYNLGGCSYGDFSLREREPQAPVYYNLALNEVARAHSQDMRLNDFFSHSSSDGTPFGERVMAVYSSYDIGENIAWGYGDSRTAVLQGWMCSTEGHRENIMSPDWTELGTGVDGDFYTQDFGGAAITPPGPVAMGSHYPALPGQTATFLADWQGASAPASFEVVIDGEGHPLDLWYGQERQGVYGAERAWDGATECAEYYFRWSDEAGTTGTFPEEGSYLLGRSCAEPRMWAEGQLGGGGLADWVEEDEGGRRGGGCSAAGGGSGLWWVALAGLAGLRGRGGPQGPRRCRRGGCGRSSRRG